MSFVEVKAKPAAPATMVEVLLVKGRQLRISDQADAKAIARLTRIGRGGTVRFSDRHSHPRKRRLSLAHEIGHFELAHNHQVDVCKASDFTATDKLAEVEANAEGRRARRGVISESRWESRSKGTQEERRVQNPAE